MCPLIATKLLDLNSFAPSHFSTSFTQPYGRKKEKHSSIEKGKERGKEQE